MKVSKSIFKLSNKNLLLGTCTVSATALLMITTPVAHAETVETSTTTTSTTKTTSVKENKVREETKGDSDSTEKVDNQLKENKAEAPNTNKAAKENSEKGLNVNETSTTENDAALANKENVVVDSETNSAAPINAGSSASIPDSPAISTSELSDNSKKNDKPALETTPPKLNDKVAEVVKNAGLDVSKLSNHEIEELNKINFAKNDDKKPTNLSIKDLVDIGNTIIKQDPKYAVPFFNASEIKNMSAAYTRDAQTGKEEQLEIWDSWPVQDPVTGTVTNYHGYQLVIAMMGIPRANDSHLYLLFNKYGDNNFENWKNAGSIFGYNESPELQEWSGSAILNNDDSIQLFYTSNDTSNGKNNDQRLATANLKLAVDTDGIKIINVDNDHIIFEGDGTNYQTYEQYAQGEDRVVDDYSLRDAHVVQEPNGTRYLVFESTTGSNDYQGIHQMYKWNNYGGDDKFNVENFLRYVNNPADHRMGILANAALGILKLNNDENNPKVEEVYAPLVTSLLSSDELERPNVVKLGNKYYLFTTTRFYRGTDSKLTDLINETVGDNVAMLGFVSDSLNGVYTPLNGSGAVLTASVPSNWRTATYSYYAVPVEGKDNQVLVTSYMTNRGEVAGEGKDATWAPSFLVQINPDNTTTVLGKMTKQGDWIWDDKSNDPNMVGVLDKDASNSAALPDEWDKPISPDLIGHYGLRDHSPEPEEPEVPQNDTPITPDQPTNETQTIEPPTVMDPTASVPTDDKDIPKKDPADPDSTPNKDVPISGDKKQPHTPEKLTQGSNGSKKHVGTSPTINKKIVAKKQSSVSDTPKLTQELPATGTKSSILSIVVGAVASVLGLLGLVDTSKFKK